MKVETLQRAWGACASDADFLYLIAYNLRRNGYRHLAKRVRVVAERRERLREKLEQRLGEYEVKQGADQG